MDSISPPYPEKTERQPARWVKRVSLGLTLSVTATLLYAVVIGFLTYGSDNLGGFSFITSGFLGLVVAVILIGIANFDSIWPILLLGFPGIAIACLGVYLSYWVIFIQAAIQQLNVTLLEAFILGLVNFADFLAKLEDGSSFVFAGFGVIAGMFFLISGLSGLNTWRKF